jgi:hypothetical protein
MSNRSEEIDALLRMGFWANNDGGYHHVWTAPDGTKQMITLSPLQAGWSFVWQRGITYTIAEATAPTFVEIVVQLWDAVFRRSENYLQALRTAAQIAAT